MATREKYPEAPDRKIQSGALDLYNGQFPTAKVSLTNSYERFRDRPHAAANLVLYPDGSAELTGCHMGFPHGGVNPPSSEEEKRERAARRARRRIRLVARFNSCRYLWTLTVRGGLADYASARTRWNKFVRRCRRHYPDFGAIAVPERHTGGGVNDGTFHIHFAVNEFYDVNIVRVVWYSIVGFNAENKPMGQVDVQAPEKGNFSPAHIANYLMKYITKELAARGREKSEHQYWVTRNFVPRNLNRKENQHLKFGYRSLQDYQGRPSERESRFIGLIFHLTGKIGRVAWRSQCGRYFRISTTEGTGITEVTPPKPLSPFSADAGELVGDTVSGQLPRSDRRSPPSILGKRLFWKDDPAR